VKIGIISDTHDRLEAVEKAVDLFNTAGVEVVLHAGDLVSPFVVPRLAKLKAKLYYVWGNNDGDRLLVSKRMAEFGMEPPTEIALLNIAGKRIALLHGTSELIVEALAKSMQFDIIVRGHTHKAEVIRGNCLVINPGEACGYLTGKRTVAVLETDTMDVQLLEI